jgi:hypothetical protein
MTSPKPKPGHPESNKQHETTNADYYDGLRILAHLIAKKYLQNQHSNINLQASKGEAGDRNQSKK